MNVFSGPVVVTGGAGFIGSEVVDQLAGAGNQVTVIDNLVNGRRENIAPALDKGATFKEVDICDQAAMQEVLAGAEVVFHLACLGVRHSLSSPQENHAVNATATLQLVNAADKLGVARFVQVSSSEVYGTAQKALIDEDHPTRPTTVYGAAKLAGESYVRARHETHGFDVVIVRPFNAFGPRSHHEGDSGEVIPKMMLRALAGRTLVVFGDGSQTRDFTYVSDTARAIIAAGVSSQVIGQTINVGAGRETTILELAKIISAMVGQNDPKIEFQDPRPGDIMRLCADAKLARDKLDYKPEISLADGLIALRDWYTAAGVNPETLLKDERVRAWLAPD